MLKQLITSGTIAAAAGCITLPSALAQTQTHQVAPAGMSAGSVSTAEFVRKASQSDEFETKEGKLAERVGSPETRKFGAMMVRDHMKTTEGLHAALRKAGMPVPPPPPLDPEQQAMLSKLQGLKGLAFDRAYLEQAVASHKQALALHEMYDHKGDVAPIAAASRAATPIVKEHLRVAERLAAGKPAEM